MKFSLSAFIFLYLNYDVVFSLDFPCNLKTSVDISEGDFFANGTIIKDGIIYEIKNQFDGPNGTKFGCLCNIKPCVRKCCPLGEYLLKKNCTPTEVPFLIPESIGPPLDNFSVVIGEKCDPPKGRVLVGKKTQNDFQNRFIIQSDGRLYLPSSDEIFNPEDYCIDHINDQNEIKGLICANRKHQVSFTNVIGMTVSMPFLLATFLVYAILPDRNLHGTMLMYYVITLFGAYFLLVFNKLHPPLGDTLCITLAIFCLFFFMVSFFVMNVMSIDIWWTFSGYRGFSNNKNEKEKKTFLIYTSYAWGVPLLVVAAVITVTLKKDIPLDAWYNPRIGREQCWIYEGYPKLLYFFGPISIILTINLILFIITAFKIKGVHRDTAVLKREGSRVYNNNYYENDKQRFHMYLKLMLAMGINWIMEIIIWVISWQTNQVSNVLLYFPDFVNAVYGVFIFFMFVFKKNIWRLLKRRYYMVMGKPNLAKTMTLADNSTNISMVTNFDKNNVINKQKTDDGNISTSDAV